MFLLGLDIGSSSVKASLWDVDKGGCCGHAQSPHTEMPILAIRNDWAEQDPIQWWHHVKVCVHQLLSTTGVAPEAIRAIGISYQMHGLVCVDKEGNPLRNAIIWCDSRAVSIGNEAFEALGKEYCETHLLNSPGNFTASKLRWVRTHEPDLYQSIHKIMLPGDFIAFKLTGERNTTISGLSEGVFWDFANKKISAELLNHYHIEESLIPDLTQTFGFQGALTSESAAELGLTTGTPVTYRAGDQPNNALSLNVFHPGEVAATAGTSGVVYGISDTPCVDPSWRVNSFAHVNHTDKTPRLGVLLCLNGVGILNSWLRRELCPGMSYPEMNLMASDIPVGSDGLMILPFGNGAERMLANQNPGCTIGGLHFPIHGRAHLLRAAQEGIAFAFTYGLEIMQNMGVVPGVIRAGRANMFLSPLFAQTLSNTSGATIELFNTDGSTGAALGAGLGSGIYSSREEAFAGLKSMQKIAPETGRDAYLDAYERWKEWKERVIPGL